MTEVRPWQPGDDALPDRRDEVFVAEFVKTEDALLACTRAGITDPKYPIAVLARRMLGRPEIIAAIEAAREEARREPERPLVPTKLSISADLDRVFEAAMDDGGYAAAVSAKKTQAQLLGLLETTMNVRVTHEVSTMTDEQLEQIAARGAGPVIEGEVVRRGIADG